MLSRVETTDRAHRRLAVARHRLRTVLRCHHLMVTSHDCIELTRRVLASTHRLKAQARIARMESRHTCAAVAELMMLLYLVEPPTQAAPSVSESALVVSA
jgi:hypothetical protein